jgi:hypothetical protein
MKTTKPVRAWHFVNSTLRDGRPVPRDGELLRFNDNPILCKQGLHASLDPFDALSFAPGGTLCLVECGGQIKYDNDKLVCTERTIVVRMDAEPLLRWFARMQALSVAHLYNAAPQVLLDYLMTGDESIRDAALGAAWDAAWCAAWDAAWGAAWDAAWDAAWGAARKDFNALVNEAFADWLEEAP